MRQLGALRRRDPELYEFMEEAFIEKLLRVKGAIEGARS